MSRMRLTIPQVLGKVPQYLGITGAKQNISMIEQQRTVGQEQLFTLAQVRYNSFMRKRKRASQKSQYKANQTQSSPQVLHR